MRWLFLALLGFFHFSSLALAESTQPSLEAYGKLPFISSAQISPDGTKIATLANDETGSKLLVFQPDGTLLDRIDIEKWKARSVSFFDNDHVILTVSETTDSRWLRTQYEASTAVAISLEEKYISTLLRGDPDLYFAQSGLGRIIGRGENTDEVLMPAYIGPPGFDPVFSLMRVSLKDGTATTAKRGTRDTIDWFSDGQGKALAREVYNNAKNRYAIEYRDGRKWKKIFEDKDAVIPPVAINGVMPDYSGLVFTSTGVENGFDELRILSFDGEISQPILARPNREVEVVYTDPDRRVVGVRYAGIEPDYEFLDSELEAAHEFVSQSLPNATLKLESWSEDRSKILYQLFDAAVGNIWLLVDAEEKSLSAFANNHEDIPANEIGSVIAIEYSARDGMTIPAILTIPPKLTSQTDHNLPLIVLPHGGPSAYDQMDFHWMAQYFANRGYLVLQPNFRGSAGYGQAFLDAGRGEWGGKMQDDITDGVEALSIAGMADKSRVCIVGASYGGYAALAGAAFTPDLYKCVIAIAPVSDLNRMLRDEKRDHGGNHWVVDYWEGLMADGDARTAKLKSISPVNFAENVTAPVLLLHGDDDTVVPYTQSTLMERALRRAGKQVELIKLKGEDHWLSVADTRLQTLREMDRFIAEHLPVE